jgi:hypothetical protein
MNDQQCKAVIDAAKFFKATARTVYGTADPEMLISSITCR